MFESFFFWIVLKRFESLIEIIFLKLFLLIGIFWIYLRYSGSLLSNIKSGFFVRSLVYFLLFGVNIWF